MFRTRELRNHECAEREEERTCYITRKVAAKRREWYNAKDIHEEDKEEARKQIRCIFLIPLSYARLNHIIHDIHSEHLYESSKSLWSLVTHLLVLIPSCRYQDYKEQQY